ncbi:MAG TPA: hypothetical protein P5229_03260 [Candidatus Gracilibacteria bacterium]|nr:hypothetical protein [Candidatus Gracilibacteria bacterium]
MSKFKGPKAKPGSQNANHGYRNTVAWIALFVSLIGLSISTSQYFQTQRPKLRLHPDSRLIAREALDQGKTRYTFGLVFENCGSIECRGVGIAVIAISQNGQSSTAHTATVNDILPGSIFHTRFTLSMPAPPTPAGTNGAAYADNPILHITATYPAVPFGQHKQTFDYYFHEEAQELRHCGPDRIALIKKTLGRLQ